MRHGWVWGLYVLSLAWVAVLFVHVEQFLNITRSETYRQEGRRLVAVWADRIAEADGVERREALLRRFSGDVDSRSAALLNDQGQMIQHAGESSPPPPRLSFSEPIDRPLNNGTWAYWAPLWVAGRRDGYLAWVRDSSPLEKERTHTQRGLLAAWVWWAGIGALSVAFATRIKPNS
jgi:hypothetical protein